LPVSGESGARILLERVFKLMADDTLRRGSAHADPLISLSDFETYLVTVALAGPVAKPKHGAETPVADEDDDDVGDAVDTSLRGVQESADAEILAMMGDAVDTLLREVQESDQASDREALKKAFDSFDTDDSGELSKEEFRAVMMRTTGEGEALNDAEFEKLFSKVDLNEDGNISFDEYHAWSQE
jgi:hypothetical protein